MKTYIWTIPTRLVHWSLAIGLVIAYILGGEESSLNLHTALGYFVVSLVLFRIIWGLIGPKYSKFSDFPISPKSIKLFFFKTKESKTTNKGHNPLASIIMLLIYINILAVGCTGMLTLAGEGQGFLSSFWVINNSELYEELHEVFVNVLIVLVSLHLLGILTDVIFHRENGTLLSIFTGYKNLDGESVKLNIMQKVYAFIWILFPFMLLIYTINFQNVTENEKNSKYEQYEEDDD